MVTDNYIFSSMARGYLRSENEPQLTDRRQLSAFTESILIFTYFSIVDKTEKK